MWCCIINIISLINIYHYSFLYSYHFWCERAFILFLLLSLFSGNCPISDKLQENTEDYSQGESSGSSARAPAGHLWEMWIWPGHHGFITKRSLWRHFGPELLSQWLWPEGSVRQRYQRSESTVCLSQTHLNLSIKSRTTAFYKVTL